MRAAPKFTPGPWVQWAGTNIINGRFGDPRLEFARICEVSTNTYRDQGRHNINLITAAPDLYAALAKATHAACGDYSWLREARAALARAEAQ
jgi:hypothetical protein